MVEPAQAKSKQALGRQFDPDWGPSHPEPILAGRLATTRNALIQRFLLDLSNWANTATNNAAHTHTWSNTKRDKMEPQKYKLGMFKAQNCRSKKKRNNYEPCSNSATRHPMLGPGANNAKVRIRRQMWSLATNWIFATDCRLLEGYRTGDAAPERSARFDYAT